MKILNRLLTANSLIALLAIIERLSPTTKIILQPYRYIGLHEYNQTVLFLPLTLILSFFAIKLFTNNFQTLHQKNNVLLMVLFILGVYLYGAGEGWHEVASFTLNRFCSINHVVGNLCGGLFINDFYAGNIIFFIGAVLMNISLMGLAIQQPLKKSTRVDMLVLIVNSFVYGFTWFAYAAFDKVLIGLLFSILLTFISYVFLWQVKKTIIKYPYIIYSVIAYSFATIATLIVRFH